MSHTQYMEHLKSLDPKVLEELGLKPTLEVMEGVNPNSRRKIPAPYATKEEESEYKDLLEETPKVKPSAPPRVICQRCHSLSHHNSPLAKLSVLSSVLFPSPPAPVPKHIATLKQSKSATVVLVLDLVDFPLSIPQPVIEELLKVQRRKYADSRNNQPRSAPIIVVGNKFDVMPRGTQKHRVVEVIQQHLEKHGLAQNVRSIHIISAKNPAGDDVSMLLKSIGSAWLKYGKGNVVMVGAENVGKSQLLNAFLMESGRWKPSNQELLNQKGEEEQLKRQNKLNALLSGGDLDGNDGEDKEWNTMTGKDSVGTDIKRYKALYTERGQEKIKLYETTVSNVPGTTLEKIKVPLRVLKKYMGGNYKEVDSKWLMDTPGIRNSEGQLTNWLTLDELKVSLPKKMLKPSSFMLEEGRSFFLGGLVRIDCISVGKGPTTRNYLEADRPTVITRSGRARGSNPGIKLTVFTELPLHITSTARADGFLQKTAEGELTPLQPPFGSRERLEAFPGLAPAFDGDVVIVNQPFSSRPATRIVPRSIEATKPQRADPFSKLDDRFDEGLSHDNDKWDGSNFSRREKENARLQLAGQYGICDLVFSGIGWVTVSGKFRGESQSAKLRVWTPKGQGAGIRDGCLLPEAAAEPVAKTAGGIRQNRKIFARLPQSQQKESSEGKEGVTEGVAEGVAERVEVETVVSNDVIPETEARGN
ncbi:hypothetical protein BGX27_004522 [Mortierella sp. AM989]|nr:hypothetical protein BGX27_004522 [Mortierella sp. AM989]